MKKRTKKLAAMGMAAVMAAALLSGCGKTKATPENLLRDMTEKAEKAESAVANLKFNISLSSGGAELAVNMDMDMEVTAEPEASYGKGEISVDIAGSGMSTEMEMYSVKEDDQYVTYTMMDGQWTKEISDEEEALGDIEGMTGDIEDYADKFELEKELAEINGEECFELTGELDGDTFSEMFLSDMLDSFSGYGFDEEDISDTAFPCTIDIYKDSILPARFLFDLTDVFKPAMEDSGVTATDCYIEMTFMEYDSVDEIVVPDEALEAEENSGLLEDFSGDGGSVQPAGPAEQSAELGSDWESYTVQINDTVVTLPCTIADLESAGVTMDREYTPEDYVVNAGEYELAWFMNDNGNEIMVDMINNTDGPLAVKDCLVGGISVSAYDVEDGGLTVIFPGGVRIGTAEADVLAAYGEPDHSSEDAEYGNSYYWYGEDSYMSGCSIMTEAGTGLVDSMDINCQ